MTSPRFSDDSLQALAGQVFAEVTRVAGTGETRQAIDLLGRFLDHADGLISGPNRPVRRRLSDYLLSPADRNANDRRMLWLMVAELLATAPALKAPFLLDLEALFTAPETSPHIPLGIIPLASPPDLGVGLSSIYDRIDREADLAVRHACYQRLLFGMGSLYDQFPSLMKRRAESYRLLLDAYGAVIEMDDGGLDAGAKPGRLAILTGRLAGRRHSPSRMLCTYAHALRAEGFDVAIFQTRDMELAADEGYLFRRQSWPEPEPSLLADLARTDIGIHDVDFSASRLDQVRQVMDQVRAFQPAALISLGATDSIAKGLLARRLPLIEIFMGGFYHLYQRADVHLTPIQRVQAEVEARRCGDVSRLPAHTFHAAAIDLEAPVKPFDRVVFGFPASAVVAVTAGNALDVAIDDTFLDMMAELLLTSPNLHWLAIGPRHPARLAALKSHPGIGDRVVASGFQPDLAAAIAAGDIYLNPFRQIGGGYAAVDALAAGKPVLSLGDCDVGTVIGSDFVCHSRAAYRARLVDLLESPEKPSQLGEMMAADLAKRRDPRRAAAHIARLVGELHREPRERGEH